MREILFRGKDKSGKWHYGDYLEEAKSGRYPALESMHFIAVKVCRGELPELKWIIPETRGEFTGLTDKNGTKVFEGDILSAHLDEAAPQNETRLIVVWHDCGWYGKNLDGVIDDFEDGFIKQFTVIGNVHDNPELLNYETEE